MGRSTIVVDFDDFESDAFDADADSITNLQERIDGTSPFDAQSPLNDSGNGQINLSDCGSSSVLTTQPSIDVSNPLAILPGTLHTGSLPPGARDYYSAPLDVGQYLLVVDVHDPGGVRNSDITIEQVSETGEVIETLIDDLELDKVRFLRTINQSAPDTLLFRVRERDRSGPTPEIYTFGIFEVNDAVPAPFFVECPMVIPVSSGDSVSFEFANGYENEVFLAFVANEIRPYELDLFFSVLTGLNLVQASVELVDGMVS